MADSISLGSIPQVSRPATAHEAEPPQSSGAESAHGDLEQQNLPPPAGVGSAHLQQKLIAALKGTAMGIPAAALNVAASSVGAGIMRGKEHVADAVKTTGNAAAVVLAADVVLTAGAVVAGHYALDKFFCKNTPAEKMLKQKTMIAAAAAVASQSSPAIIADSLGSALTGQAISGESLKQDAINQAVGSAIVYGGLALGAGVAAVVKKVREGDST